MRTLSDMEPQSKAWGCSEFGKRVKGSKGEVYKKLSKAPCGLKGLLKGSGENHKVLGGWFDKVFPMAFCVERGRCRCFKGKGLLGRCDPARSNPSRLWKQREGKHPISGRKFVKVQRLTTVFFQSEAGSLAR